MLSDAEAPVQSRSTGSARAAATNPGEIKSLGKYQIERKVGAGGMGTVYLARDTTMRRAVALKVLPKDKAENPILVKRFRAEAVAAAALKHENIVAVYDTDEADGYLFIAMEFVDGVDLHELVSKRGPVPVKRSIEIIKQIASALQHALEHKIVHRDIKPSNLLIRRDGVAKLTDLGLARSVDDTIETGITRAGTTVGTVDYMAPEQAKNSKAADIRSDIYSLGCTWYHMLTGGPPFPDGSLTNKLQAHAVKPAPDPKAVNDNVTEGLVAVLHRMMAKKPEDRYQTPADLIKDLEASTLTKAAFSQEILDAIEEESATSIPTRSDGAKQGGHGPLPPPSRKRLEDGEDQKQGGLNSEMVKLALTVALIAGAALGIGWVAWSFSSVLDSPANFANNGADPFANSQHANSSVSVAPVGGTPGGATAPMIEGSTPVAPVYGTSGTAIQPGTSAATGNPSLTSGQATTTPGAQGSNSGVGIQSGASGNAASTGRANPGSTAPFDPVKPPTWVADVVKQSAPGLRPLTVGPGSTSASHYNTLNEAFSHINPEGAVIQLIGNGPFLLNTPIALSTKRLVITASANTQPVLVLAGGGSSGSSGFSLAGGTLELKGIHFVAEATASPTATLIAVRDGSAFLRECSVTVGGDASAITVLALEGAAPGGAKVLVDRTVIRGDVRTALDLRTSPVEAVIQDSLIVTSHGAALRLSAGSNSASKSDGDPLRSIKCLHSTLCSRGRIFDLAADSVLEQAPATHLSLVQSVCCTGHAEGPRMLLGVDGWKQDALRTALSWTIEGSALLGFEDLLTLGDASGLRVKDGDAWRIFWRQKADPEQFRGEVWPRNINRVASASISDFDVAHLPEAARKIGDSGEPPGAAATRLKVPEAVAPERLAALAHRRALPSAATKARPEKPHLSVDLRKDDLGVVLSRGDWPDGAVIEAVGFGGCAVSPVVIANRSVRIVFRQAAEGGPLRIVPKDTGRDTEALFRVEQGTLVLDGLRWQGPEGRPNVPQWLVSALDSNVVLLNCDLQGPDRGVAPYQGIVRFATGTSPTDKSPSFAVIDSFLHSPGALIRAETGVGTLFLRNSLLVARGTALDLRPRAVGENLPLVVDIVNSTLAANQSVFHWTAASLNQPPRNPARVFVDGAAFAPPFPLRAGDASQPTILTYSGPVLEQRQVEWWGGSNGVSAEIKHFLRPEGTLPAPEKTGVQAWNETWGAGHELQLLTRPDGVMLADPLPKKREALTPRSYLLHPNCKGVVWAEGRSIGADVAALDQAGPDKVDAGSSKTTPNTTKKSNAPTPKPGGNKGGF